MCNVSAAYKVHTNQYKKRVTENSHSYARSLGNRLMTVWRESITVHPSSYFNIFLLLRRMPHTN